MRLRCTLDVSVQNLMAANGRKAAHVGSSRGEIFGGHVSHAGSRKQ